MEGIILLFGGLLGGAFLLAGAIAAAGAGLVLDIVSSIISLLLSQRRSPAPTSGPTASAFPFPTPTRKQIRTAGIVSGGLLISILLIGSIVQLFFFKPAASALLHRHARNAGLELNFADISGNLFTGAFSIEKLELQSMPTGGNSWSAHVDSASVNIAMLRLLGKRAWLDSLIIDNATVGVETAAPPPFDPGAAIKTSPPPASTRHRGKRRFGISETRLTKLQLSWKRPAGKQDLTVERFACENLMSEFALLQIFFRSHAHGRLNDTPWKIETRKTGELARSTKWTFENLPLDLAADMVGGPFRIFTKGTLDVLVSDDWSLDDGPDIDLDWRFVFHDFDVDLPGGTTDSPLAGALVRHLKQADNPLDIHFTLTWNENDLRGSSSTGTRKLSRALLQALLPDTAGEVTEKAKQAWRKLRDWTRDP